jgi:L-seryl-tRNA(Ser) seleniumtransferase
MTSRLLRQIPKTDNILSRPAIKAAQDHYPYAFVKATVQACLDDLREKALHDRIDTIPPMEAIEDTILSWLQAGHLNHLKRVINATGVVLHTNLGRAPLGEAAAAHLAELAKGYCNLEYDLENGKRGSRYAHVEKLLCELTGAEAAMVVNNNAGAVFLMLNTLAKGKKVAVSRGELVEIGGSFRIPEIMYESGAEMVEIGCTNKTHPRDYERAMDELGAEHIFKAYTSNFVINGFTESVSVAEMAKMAHERGGLVLFDQGSGFLFPPEAMGMHVGNLACAGLKDGADVVCFSGDKLLGSAQCGILLGKKEYIERIKKNQLTRMLRIDKLSLAVLEICLQFCRDPKLAQEKIPALRMLSMTEQECRFNAEQLCGMIREAIPTCDAKVISVKDEAGGGSMAGVLLDGAAVAMSFPSVTAERAETLLHLRELPVVARVSRDCLLLSVRTLFEEDLPEVVEAVRELYALPMGRER